MKFLLLLAIHLYWGLFPKAKRRKCIFRISCSKQVYQTTKSQGFLKGIQVFKYRYRNCRHGFQLFDLQSGERMMKLPNGDMINETEISERFTNH